MANAIAFPERQQQISTEQDSVVAEWSGVVRGWRRSIWQPVMFQVVTEGGPAVSRVFDFA